MAQKTYFYETVVAARDEQLKKEYNSLEKGMYIKRNIVEFAPREILPRMLQMTIPVDFVTMPPQYMARKYTGEHSPLIVKTSLDTTVNLSFSLLQAHVENVAEYARSVLSMLVNANPAFEFYNFTESGNQLAWYDLKFIALDDRVYQIQYFTPIGEQLLIGSFACRFRDMEEWKNAAQQMIRSIQDLTENPIGMRD